MLGCNCTKYLPAIRWNLLWIWIVQNKLNFWGWSFETRGVSQNKTSSTYRELVISFKGMLFDWIYLILRWLLKVRILHNVQLKILIIKINNFRKKWNSYFVCISNLKKNYFVLKNNKKKLLFAIIFRVFPTLTDSFSPFFFLHIRIFQAFKLK